MKKLDRKVVLSVACLATAFFIGLTFTLHTKLSAAKKVDTTLPAICTQAKLCKTSPLSMFSKQKLTEATTPSGQSPQIGFCLSVPVLLYHHIQPQSVAAEKGQTSLNVDNGVFDQQMAYLASNGYTTISAEALVNAVISHAQLSAKTVVVTMDDGYLDNYVYAYPTLQKYHLIGNLMVPTGLLGITAGTNTYYTWDELHEMVNSGSMYAYNHTWSHYPMQTGPAEKDQYEAMTAQNELQSHLGHAAPIFVYPYGSGQTTPWVASLLKNNGFVAAFSTLYGRYQCDGSLFSLPRIHIGNAPLSSYGI